MHGLSVSCNVSQFIYNANTRLYQLRFCSIIFSNKLDWGGKVVELDIMKFYGILLVILGHIAMTYTPTSQIVTCIPSSFMITLKQFIYTFHMPMFVFVSGAIYAYQVEVRKREQRLFPLAVNKFKRLMIPFYVFGFLWVYPTMVILGLRDPFSYLINVSYGVTGTTAMYVISKYTHGITKTRIYKWISLNSFGIYLFHAMFIYQLEFVLRNSPIQPILLSTIIFFVSTAISIFFTEFIRKSHLGIIIGEKSK